MVCSVVKTHDICISKNWNTHTHTSGTEPYNQAKSTLKQAIPHSSKLKHTNIQERGIMMPYEKMRMEEKMLVRMRQTMMMMRIPMAGLVLLNLRRSA